MSIEVALQSLVNIFSLAQRPIADPRSLGDFSPSLSDLERADGLVMQPEKSNDGITQRLDGGDSAHRTGVLAFCNSIQDAKNLGRFMITPALMTRHPTQPPWNNPSNSSRDQLLGYIAGCWRAQRYDIVEALYAAHKARIPMFTCQNTDADAPGTPKNPAIGDLLLPDNLMYFRVCAGDKGAATDIAAQLNLYIAILATPTSEDHEINQILLESIVCGQLDIFAACSMNDVSPVNAFI